MPLLTIFQLYHGYLVLLVEYTKKNHRPVASLTNLINNVVSSNKGVLIADIYIRGNTLFKTFETTTQVL
jgi:hypothetical protein